MSQGSVRLAFMLISSLGAGIALSSVGCTKEKDCAVGSEGCDCTAKGGCDPGLNCLSKVCVAGAPQTNPDGGGTTPVAFDPNKACEDLLATCTKLNDCYPAFLKIAWGDVATCRERLKLDCLDGAKAPDTGFTQSTVSACISAINSASCEDIIYRKVPACDFKGSRSNGAGCGTDDQCKSGHCGITDSSCGVCADPLKAGQTCQVDDDCEPGLTCSDDKHCVLPGAGGTGCSDTQPCKLGYYCRNGSCAAVAQDPGANCQDFAGCAIERGLFCNVSVGKCQNLKWANPGDKCGLVNGELWLCTTGGNCAGNPGATEGVCAAAGKDGDTCGVNAQGRDCLPPARCIGGRCKTPNSASCN